MDMKEKNDIFIDNTNLQGRMSVFHDKLRKHLSNEYLFLSEKKDNLENEILQLKMEKEQEDKTLFPNIGKKDVRKYFSPLNISEIDEDQKDEKEKQLLVNISRISEEAEMLDGRMLEIKDFLQDIETMLDDDSKDSLSGFLLKKEKNRITVEDFYKKHETHPELLENLKELVTFFQDRYDELEILLEFEDEGIQLETRVVANILRQLTINIVSAVEDYDISMILIEGKVTEDKIILTLNCMCEDGPVDTFKISYDIDRG